MRLFAAFLALWALALGGIAAAAPIAEIPMQYEDERPYIPVAYDGGAEHWFILDTGSTGTAMDTVLAERFGLTIEHAGSVSGAGAGRSAIGRVGNVTLTIAGLSFSFDEIHTLPLSDLLPKFTGRKAPGIFGSRLFADYVVEMDFAANHVRLHDRASFTHEGGIAVPIEIEGGSPIARATLALPNGRAVAGRFLIDTGAKAQILLTEAYSRTNVLYDAFPAEIDSPLGAGVGGPTEFRFVRLESLVLTGAPATILNGAIAGLSLKNSLRTRGLDGLIGAEYLRRFRVFFDYDRKRMILEPREPGNGVSEFDMSGIYFTASSDDLRTFTIARIYPRSPAFEAGLREGDILTAIDGASPSSSLSDLRTLLKSEPGRKVTLTFDRGGTPIAADLVLRRLL